VAYEPPRLQPGRLKGCRVGLVASDPHSDRDSSPSEVSVARPRDPNGPTTLVVGPFELRFCLAAAGSLGGGQGEPSLVYQPIRNEAALLFA
jgi:hypothetical protein